MTFKKLTHEEFVESLKNINSNIKVLGVYINKRTKIKVKCNVCGNEWEATPSNLLMGRGCPHCKKIKLANLHKYNTEIFITKAKGIHDNKYNYSKVDYKDCFSKIKIICPIHGEFELTPSDHLSGRGCPKCANNLRKTTNQFIIDSIKVHGNIYNYDKVNYISAHLKVCITCPKHGDFWQEPANHLCGKGCPVCRKSKGEGFIENYLKLKNINFIPQYLINIDLDINPSGKAYIDFYLPDYNSFIEYNGELHYIEKEYFGGKIEFERQLKRDEFVRNYCKENKIRLIEISFNIKLEELEKILNTYIYE